MKIFYFLSPRLVAHTQTLSISRSLFYHPVKVEYGLTRVKGMARRLHWLIGLSTLVLTLDFSPSYKHGDDVEDVTPFSGGLVLPTRLQVLKLHLFFKDETGRGNRHVKPGEVTGKVEKVVKHYWKLAGFDTVSSTIYMDQDFKAS